MKPLPAAVLAGIAGAAAAFVLLVVGIASSCIWASPHPKMPISSRSITEVIKKPALKQAFSSGGPFQISQYLGVGGYVMVGYSRASEKECPAGILCTEGSDNSSEGAVQKFALKMSWCLSR